MDLISKNGIRKTPLSDPRVAGCLLKGSTSAVVFNPDDRKTVQYHSGRLPENCTTLETAAAKIRELHAMGFLFALGISAEKLSEAKSEEYLAGLLIFHDSALEMGINISQFGLTSKILQSYQRPLSYTATALDVFACQLGDSVSKSFIPAISFPIEANIAELKGLPTNQFDPIRKRIVKNEEAYILAVLFRQTTSAVLFSDDIEVFDRKFAGYNSCKPWISFLFSYVVSYDLLSTLLSIATTHPAGISTDERNNLARAVLQSAKIRANRCSRATVNGGPATIEEWTDRLVDRVKTEAEKEFRKPADRNKAMETIKTIIRQAQKLIPSAWEALIAA